MPVKELPTRERLDLAGKRILVVEDDPVVAIDYYFQLKALGAAQVLEPSNRAALGYLADHAVDAAIVDFTLRDGCCLPVLDALTAKRIPFIVISGDTFAMRNVTTNAPVLSKPVTSTEVYEALSAVLH
jgi:CheY-like chemotaxis protein